MSNVVFIRCDHYNTVTMFVLFFLLYITCNIFHFITNMSICYLKGFFFVVVLTSLVTTARGPVSWDLISLSPVVRRIVK